MSGWRLAQGGRIDRSRPLRFTWGGRVYDGFAGDTLASALLANGVSIIGRSFKYHRPRGLLAAGLEEPNAIVQLERGPATIPNPKATHVELYEGLVAAPVNARPSVDFDLMAVNAVVKRFIPAAFYYKTFMWPSWHLFEPLIRKAAGLGIAPEGADPDVYEHRFAHCDLLVVGSGAAGLAAAEAAAGSGKRIILVEADCELGGGLLWAFGTVEGQGVEAWRAARIAALAAAPNVTVMARTMAFGFYDHGLVGLSERVTDHLPPAARAGARQRLWKVRAGDVILATGAFERPLVFGNNDLPGIMLASAAQAYALRYGVAVGRTAVFATNNDSAYDAAFALQDAGVAVAAIVDSRPGSGRTTDAEARGIAVHIAMAPLRAHGRRKVAAVTIGSLEGRTATKIDCDVLLTSGGWNPTVHLHSQSGGALDFDAERQAFVPSRDVQNAVNVGGAAGQFEMEAALAAARAAARGGGQEPPAGGRVGPLRRIEDGGAEAGKAWLDFQNDVTVGDVQLAARENFRSVEHVKRYTTLGMASDQGKTSNVSAIQVMAGLLDKAPEAIGTTRFRPPFDPVTIGSFAGRAIGADLETRATTAAHGEHVAAGGVMEQYGGWWRAAYYPKAGEDEHRSIAREVRAVRGSVGIFDASPLGKIEVQGPDAAEFLQRIYVNQVKSLKVGRCRYGLILNENGIVFDDGVFARIGENHFLVGTTSGHAGAVTDMLLEWLQCEWPQLRVMVENVTTGWAVLNLAGPNARAVLADIGTSIELSPEAFPHMACRDATVGGVPARIQRVSFSGELSYEVAVPWGYGAALWAAAMRAGRRFGIAPFGVEALMAMRIEKGYLHVGSDTDGTTLPQDIGFAGAFARKTDDFVGRRSTMRPDALRKDRRQLIGIAVEDGGPALEVGSHVLAAERSGKAATQGWVTSSVFSPTLDRPVAMALVASGRDRIGETVRVWDMGKERMARLVDQRFYDPQGERLDG
jgi:sarcosine oxidase subunit alpha